MDKLVAVGQLMIAMSMDSVLIVRKVVDTPTADELMIAMSMDSVLIVRKVR